MAATTFLENWAADKINELRGERDSARSSLAALTKSAGEMQSVLEDIEEYLDQRADCEIFQDGYSPNEEMRLLVQVRAALGKDA